MTGNKHGLEDLLKQELQTKYKKHSFFLVLQQMKENLHRKTKDEQEETEEEVEETAQAEEVFVLLLQEQFQLEKEEQVS